MNHDRFIFGFTCGILVLAIGFAVLNLIGG